MGEIPPHIQAESEQRHQDLLHLLSHLVVVARSNPTDNTHDLGTRLLYHIVWAEWPPRLVAAILSIAAAELARSDWETHPRHRIEGIADLLPLAGEPTDEAPPAEGTPD